MRSNHNQAILHYLQKLYSPRNRFIMNQPERRETDLVPSLTEVSSLVIQTFSSEKPHFMRLCSLNTQNTSRASRSGFTTHLSPWVNTLINILNCILVQITTLYTQPKWAERIQRVKMLKQMFWNHSVPSWLIVWNFTGVSVRQWASRDSLSKNGGTVWWRTRQI